MQNFIKVARLQFGKGHLIGLMKIKTRERLSSGTHALDQGELYYEDEVSIVRIDSMANIVHLARFVEVDQVSAVENEPLEFAKLVAFFVRGQNGHPKTNLNLPHFRDQLGLGETVLKDVPSIDPVVNDGIHTCYVWDRIDERVQERFYKLTTRLSDMSCSQIELARWENPRLA